MRQHLLPRFGPMPLGRITGADVRAWLAELTAADDLRPATVRKAGQVLAKIMSAAVDEGLVARSPCHRVRLPAEDRRAMIFLEPAQIAELAATVDPHYRVLVLTAAYLGLRWGELAGLRAERVDLLRRTVSVVEQLTEVNGRLAVGPPKTAAGRRSVSVPAGLAELLQEQLERRSASGLMFPSPGGDPMRRSNFRRRAWAPATRQVGLDGLRFHDLRHSAVALAIAQGAHPKAIQERMGHSSITVTLDRYGHLFPGLDERIADGLDDTLRHSLAVTPRSSRGQGVVELAR